MTKTRKALVVFAAAGITLGGAGIAAAAMNQYTAIAYGSTEAFAESQAVYYAQQQGYSAGYKYGQCSESGHSSYQYSDGSWQVTAYVTCYDPTRP
ncbi:hypothetical protein [Amycolatopsis sp. CA-230715]|uniref:hypothetical protein n=1 Tax=Amycolatopsis sp. CA-230715 TaxID=2745196 RepID=UPI001C039C34|nr:hypothetical protein [Amycolatopsis sp. CA-230715]QWF80782.1 hypothetical protein HUW46_04206 [Amycolatopsis sp. CA-230715]